MLYEMEHEAFENKCGVGKVFNKYKQGKYQSAFGAIG
jgi:hypothetical protein